VDAAIALAFLESVSSVSLEVGLRVLEQLEQDLATQRPQRELQLQQARYEVRLAQRPRTRTFSAPDDRPTAETRIPKSCWPSGSMPIIPGAIGAAEPSEAATASACTGSNCLPQSGATHG
jgi:hypothetical protein